MTVLKQEVRCPSFSARNHKDATNSPAVCLCLGCRLARPALRLKLRTRPNQMHCMDTLRVEPPPDPLPGKSISNHRRTRYRRAILTLYRKTKMSRCQHWCNTWLADLLGNGGGMLLSRMNYQLLDSRWQTGYARSQRGRLSRCVTRRQRIGAPWSLTLRIWAPWSLDRLAIMVRLLLCNPTLHHAIRKYLSPRPQTRSLQT